MARVISKDTFDEVVRENMEEFSMTREEAIEDAVKQFEAQGVDMSNILKTAASFTLLQKERDDIDYALSKLVLFGGDVHPVVIEQLEIILSYCEQAMRYRLYVAEKKFLETCMRILELLFDETVKGLVFAALAAMVKDNPDAMDTNGLLFTMKHLREEDDPELLVIILKLIKLSCIKHESNRQDFIAANVITTMRQILEENCDNADILKGVCSTLRALVLDDDIRHEFGNAHAHARDICESETLRMLVDFLGKYSTSKDVVGEIMLTLCAVIVRNEFCEEVLQGAGGKGLKFVMNVCKNFPDSEKLSITWLKLIKVLAGNDNAKDEIVRNGAVHLILDIMQRYQRSPEVMAAANGCIAALCLRSPHNSECFAKADVAIAILNGMRTHPLAVSVQKQGCWAIRNMVSRSRHLSPLFLENEAEELLNYVLDNLAEECEYDAKAALRDLGCNVLLREEWTGKGGALN